MVITTITFFNGNKQVGKVEADEKLLKDLKLSLADLELQTGLRVVWRRTALILAGCLLQASLAMAQPKYLGWWDTGGSSPIPAATQMAEQRGTVNITMSVNIWDDSTWEAARLANLKVIASWSRSFYRAIDHNDKVITPDMVVWLTNVQRHKDQLAAILVADEPDCNYNGATFPGGWTEANCDRARKQANANLEVLRAHFPGVPMWINYTSAYANWYTTSNASNRRLPTADWISLDCYTLWERCWGTKSVSNLLSGFLRWMTPTQSLVLIPQGYARASENPITIAATGQRYWDYALNNPRVVAVTPFIWWSIPGAWQGGREVPTIAAKWAEIGTSFLTVPPPPTGLRILQ